MVVQPGQAPTAVPSAAPLNFDPSNPPAGWQYDPITKLWQNGRNVFQVGTDGKPVQIHDQNLGSQVASNIARATQYNALGAHYTDALNTTMAEQGSLADAYRRTISDPNAPSVAREQLNQALGAADATQLSQAAGASGQNAALARRGASANMAGLAANAGQSGALLRAQEVAAAQAGLGNTLGSEATEAGNAFGATTGLGLNYSQIAGNQEQGGNSNVTANSTANKQLAVGGAKDIAAGLSGATAPAAGVPAAATPANPLSQYV